MPSSRKPSEPMNGSAPKPPGARPRRRKATASEQGSANGTNPVAPNGKPIDQARPEVPATPMEAERTAGETGLLSEQIRAATEQLQLEVRQSTNRLLKARSDAEAGMAKAREEFQTTSQQILGEIGDENRRVLTRRETSKMLETILEEAVGYQQRVAQLALHIPVAEKQFQTIMQSSSARSQALADMDQQTHLTFDAHGGHTRRVYPY